MLPIKIIKTKYHYVQSVRSGQGGKRNTTQQKKKKKKEVATSRQAVFFTYKISTTLQRTRRESRTRDD